MCANMTGQQLKKKKNSAYFYEEIYTVDKSSKKKQGDYLKLSKYSGDTLVKGQYEQDKQVGIWSLKGADNSKYISYDYNEEKLIEIIDVNFKEASIQVKKEGILKMTDVDHPAVYIGFKNEIKRTMIAVLKPPPSVFAQAKPGVVMVSFDINTEGEIESYKVETSYDNNLNKALEKAFENIKKGWLPASIGGTSVVSKMHMMFNFDFVLDASETKPAKPRLLERPDLIVIDMIFYGASH